MTAEDIEKFVRFLTKSSYKEIHPGGIHVVSTRLVLDFLIDHQAVSKENVIKWTNEEADKMEA